eukprot:5294860-Pyramimonas_sp.AAC.1
MGSRLRLLPWDVPGSWDPGAGVRVDARRFVPGIVRGGSLSLNVHGGDPAGPRGEEQLLPLGIVGELQPILFFGTGEAQLLLAALPQPRAHRHPDGASLTQNHNAWAGPAIPPTPQSVGSR